MPRRQTLQFPIRDPSSLSARSLTSPQTKGGTFRRRRPATQRFSRLWLRTVTNEDRLPRRRNPVSDNTRTAHFADLVLLWRRNEVTHRLPLSPAAVSPRRFSWNFHRGSP